MIGSGKAVSPPPLKAFLKPKEFAAELADAGLHMGERAVVARCNLPKKHRLHIATHPDFKQHYIPRSELERILSGGVRTEAVA